jgi:hypothetical protein
VDLKVVEAAREVRTGIFGIAHGRKREYRVISLNILTKAIGSWIIPL